MKKVALIILLISISQVLFANENIEEKESEKIVNCEDKDNINDSVPIENKVLKTKLQQKKDFLKIYPNPSTEYFMIEINDEDKGQNYEIQILSTNGVLVKRIKSISSSQIKIIANDLRSGMYIVNVLQKNSKVLVCRSKVIVK